ncbi:hypothetical protein CEUSTIGMA_g2522.t1 [Chlamydomonas eustigma]|uniref:Methyltransferase type 11 domain-containing protein n=1 Tax=Chlamydomonas eustigma TaxID=1157962 RepID=A0A250WW69_9CHLO|nr:hypothetical protein CEUSTIGMA_g2522.t1 [Chlamydomonas eustigma]|eukprot:GAX75078.1 hypothetical protein CEUSTIGMA_g2522.t1 [Chlamydomonas eustigma]
MLKSYRRLFEALTRFHDEGLPISHIHRGLSSEGVDIFDGSLKVKHRDRASFLSTSYDPLLETVTERLLDRLEDCKRKFPRVAVLGGAGEHVINQLRGGRAGVKTVTVIDSSQCMLQRLKDFSLKGPAARSSVSQAAAIISDQASSVSEQETSRNADPSSSSSSSDRNHLLGREGNLPDLEFKLMEGELLPVEPESFDLVISSLGLHWYNDLPAMIAQCRFALKPDGLLLAALLGGDTLQELRISCSVAQMEVLGGVSSVVSPLAQHRSVAETEALGGVLSVVSPLAQVRDAGNLLTRAGMAMPTVDLDSFKLFYACPTDVIKHLRVMGESNAVIHRQRYMPRDVALATAAVYKAMFEEDGAYPATFQVMYMTGWAPHESQQQPLERGSATLSFQELAAGLVVQGAVGGAAEEKEELQDSKLDNEHPHGPS